MLASGLPQSDHISNLRLWTPRSYWGFSKTKSFPSTLAGLDQRRYYWENPCKITQMVKCINRYFIPPIKEIIPAIIGPKLQRAFKQFKKFPRIFLCDARSFHYILLGFPFNSILSYPLEYKANSSFSLNKQFNLKFPSFKGFNPM